MAISTDVRKFLALEAKIAKLTFKIETIQNQKCDLQKMYENVGDGALKLFLDAVEEKRNKQS
jgi:hypothetical protein